MKQFKDFLFRKHIIPEKKMPYYILDLGEFKGHLQFISLYRREVNS